MTLPVALDWFERTPLADGVTLLTEPHVAPLLRCNIWHVRGRDADLLIDTGLGVASLAAAARDLLDRPVLAVATHAHMDHVGGMAEFAQRLIHPAEAEALVAAANELPLDLADWDAASRAALAAMGYDISAGLLTAVPHRGFSMGGHRLAGAEPTRLLAEGDVVETGDRAFEVLHLSGHSPGSIGLYERASGILFSGDAIYDGPLLDDIPGADIAAYADTMRRLRDLPVRLVHGGHDPSFGRARMIEIAEAWLRRRDHRETQRP